MRDHQTQAWRLLQRAQNQFDNKQFEQAIDTATAAELEGDCSVETRHFCRSLQIKSLYRLRDQGDHYVRQCMEICLADINDYPAWRDHQIAFYGKAIAANESFKRLAIILEKQGRIEDAIRLCDHAIDLDEPTDGWTKRRTRLRARLRKSKILEGL